MMMKFSQFLSEARKKPLFIAAYPTDETRSAVAQWLKDNNVPSPIPTEEIHTTIIYSRTPCDDPDIKKKCSYKGSFDRFEIWPTRDGKHALVMKVKCGDLEGRHKKLMKQLGASYDFPKYLTHMTMSYDVGPDFKTTHLKKYEGPIEYGSEYFKTLNLDWKPGDGK